MTTPMEISEEELSRLALARITDDDHPVLLYPSTAAREAAERAAAGMELPSEAGAR